MRGDVEDALEHKRDSAGESLPCSVGLIGQGLKGGDMKKLLKITCHYVVNINLWMGTLSFFARRYVALTALSTSPIED